MSVLLIDKGVLFHHIPRTGGTTVEKVLEGLQLNFRRAARKHMRLSHYSKWQRVHIRRIFTFVRNPFDYYGSVWKWLTSLTVRQLHWTKDQLWHPHCTAAQCYHQDFNRWVCCLLDREPCWYTRIVEQYVGPAHAEYCQFIGRTETLLHDLEFALKKYRVIGRWDKLPKVAREHQIQKKVVWQEEVCTRVRLEERLVFTRFYGESTYGQRLYNPILMKMS